jgi:tRNA (guanosine-2'-O-)-methyltransferase
MGMARALQSRRERETLGCVTLAPAMRSLIGTPLKRYLRQYRREHKPRGRLRALLVNVEDPANVGSIFRLADAIGFEGLDLAGITPAPPHRLITKLGRNKHERVPWRHAPQPEALVNAMRNDGYRLVALELTTDAVPFHRFSYPEQCCLVVGHEEHGIPPAVLDLCDAAVFLPMYGKGLSLNVHVALSIVAYHMRHQPPLLVDPERSAES